MVDFINNAPTGDAVMNDVSDSQCTDIIPEWIPENQLFEDQEEEE